MAAPIQKIVSAVKTDEQIQAETLQDLLASVAENKEGFEQLLGLLRELNDTGILEAINGMLLAKERIAKTLVDQALRPETTALVNNVMSAAGALTKLKPEITESLVDGLTQGIHHADESLKSPKKLGIFDLARSIKDPDINRALKFAFGFLKGFGKTL